MEQFGTSAVSTRRFVLFLRAADECTAPLLEHPWIIFWTLRINLGSWVRHRSGPGPALPRRPHPAP